MIPIASIKLLISILSELHLIPKCKIVRTADITVLEDELVQLKNINEQQKVQVTDLQRNYKDMEKQYQSIFLIEHNEQTLIKKQAEQIAKQATEISKQTLQINAYERELEVANDEFNAVHDTMTTAIDLSKRLKEALTKWTS
jgi:predicted  nucleic acid-binding Zn-ribbon protein